MTGRSDAAVQTGLRAQKAGRLRDAIQAYDRALADLPTHPTALHLRGVAHLQIGALERAGPDLRAAARFSPGDDTVILHLLTFLDRDEEADAAVATARRLLILAPASPAALDVMSRRSSRPGGMANRALAVAPADPAAWSRAAIARAAADPQQAARCARRAVLLVPNAPAALLDLADLERARRMPESALSLIERAERIRPADSRALTERAAALTDLDAFDTALEATATALVLEPSSPTGWSNRGEARYRALDFVRAAGDGERARLCAPSDPRVLANLGAYRLALGDLDRGWRLFHHRPAGRQRHRQPLPPWRGETAAHLLVRAEQGLGDELLFSTLWRDLVALLADGTLRGVTVEADPRLIPLARRALPELSWRDRFAAESEPDRSPTHWCLAGDLPGFLRATIEDFPGRGSGLAIDQTRAEAWRVWLRSVSGGRPAIGFCWRSGSRLGHRRGRYPDIESCAPLLGLSNRLFVVLQYDDCAPEIGRARLGPGSDLVLPPALDRRNDQDGVAALMTALDAVVSADTAVLALAGALGSVATIRFGWHPGWVCLGQTGNPWFPRMIDIHHDGHSTWDRTLSRVAGYLGEHGV